jgi:hypothetical protein
LVLLKCQYQARKGMRMYVCISSINLATCYDFPIELLNCTDSLYFLFFILLHNKTFHQYENSLNKVNKRNRVFLPKLEYNLSQKTNLLFLFWKTWYYIRRVSYCAWSICSNNMFSILNDRLFYFNAPNRLICSAVGQ